MHDNEGKLSARPLAGDEQENEKWQCFRNWLVRSVEYRATRRPYGLRAGKRPVAGRPDNRGGVQAVIRDACVYVAGSETDENGHIRPAIDIRHARQIEVDMNAAVEAQLSQIARFLDYLEDCYGTRVAFHSGCDDE